MKRRSIPSTIGFSDGTIESYRKVDDVVEVYVKAWNEQRLCVIFHSVVRLLDDDAGDIADFCEILESTDFLQTAIKHVYEEVPVDTPFRHFQFVGLHGDGVLDVVAESVAVE